MGGRYQIIQHVGGGGMASVYKAKDLILNRFVAVKVMNEQSNHDPDFIRRFIREAQATAKLSHPHVVNVHDVGYEGQTYYMVMEYMEGPTLKQWIARRGSLSFEEIISIAVQICEGLTHAHEQGIIHRDIKPHNIMSTSDGRFKVTDFGISRSIRTSSTITKAGTVMGSVHYFSPEQARGLEIGFTSDLYSLGVVLYEMATGRVPFDGDEPVAIALKHVQEPLPDLRKFNPQLPEGMVRVIQKAMAKDPNHRYQSADEMRQALEQVLSSNRTITANNREMSFNDPATRRTVTEKSYNIELHSGQFPPRNDRISKTYLLKKNKNTGRKKAVFSLITVVCVLILLFFIFQVVQPGKPNADNSNQTVTNPPDNKQHKKGKSVYVGSFTSRENAEKLMLTLKDKGIASRIQKAEVFGETRYRVRIGNFQKQEKAEAMLAKVRQMGFKDAYIWEN
ncbi:protein kinase [Paenactinomyces guangxiensis]|uniref:protein kinase domain-containing protein n=1 Tax=Paenactinomyces guangxiensis TaxID=1490290 RepID=UPI001C68DEA3|nr:protein kinase [Paenactinomyces guangxiensis]